MSNPAPERQSEIRRRAEKRFVGAMVMAAGGLAASLCGLCTLWGIGSSLVPLLSGSLSSGYVDEFVVTSLLFLVVGGVPAAAGLAVFVIGRRVYREGRGRSDGPPETVE